MIYTIQEDQNRMNFLYKADKLKFHKRSNQITRPSVKKNNQSKTSRKKIKFTANSNKHIPNTTGQYQNYINNHKDLPRVN
jgi:hypothetical protein